MPSRAASGQAGRRLELEMAPQARRDVPFIHSHSPTSTGFTACCASRQRWRAELPGTGGRLDSFWHSMTLVGLPNGNGVRSLEANQY